MCLQQASEEGASVQGFFPRLKGVYQGMQPNKIS
jgi:hypothetical protein